MRFAAFALTSACLLSFPLADSLAAQKRPEVPRALVLKVGTVHPVAGPAIDNGVIVIRAGRIFSVGKAGKVRIPRRAIVIDYPHAHAYPGLVDALSTAFTSAAETGDRTTNAGTDFADALDATDEESRQLVRHGITTAYVSNRSAATWRGRGAIIRPHDHGFTTLKDHRHGGTSLRMTTGFGADHALDRLKRFDKTGNVFDTLEAYEKKQADYKKSLEEYEKKRQAYLAYFAKKNKKKRAKKTAAKGTKKSDQATKNPPASKSAGDQNTTKPTAKPTGQATPPRPTRRTGKSDRDRRRRRSPADGPGRREPPGGSRGGSGKSGGGKSTGSKSGSSEKKAPKKPTYPKKVKSDPAKETLLAVVNGKLPLRVEVHRQDEIQAALFMAFAKELPGIILEYATEAGDLAKDIAEAGAPVVVTDLLPGNDAITKHRDGSLPAKLHRAGVPVAIGSGSVRNARNLTLMAAYAAGRGLPAEVAVRALTLTPAEILGVADLIGSIEPNKLADLVITSGPLLESDTRVLRVLSRGETKYEAKPAKATQGTK